MFVAVSSVQQLAKVVEGWKKREAEKDEYMVMVMKEKAQIEETLHKQQAVSLFRTVVGARLFESVCVHLCTCSHSHACFLIKKGFVIFHLDVNKHQLTLHVKLPSLKNECDRF